MKKSRMSGIAFLLAMYFLVALLGVLYLSRVEEKMNRLTLFHKIEVVRESLIIHLQQIQSHITRARTRSGADIDLLISQVHQMDNAMNSCAGCHHSPELTLGLRAMRDMSNDYQTAISGLVTASANPARIAALERRANNIGQDLTGLIQGMAFTSHLRLQAEMQAAGAGIRGAKWGLIAAILSGGGGLLLTLHFRKKRYRNSVRRLLDAFDSIAQGRIRHMDAVSEVPSELSELEHGLMQMIGKLDITIRGRVHHARLSAISDLSTNIAYEVNNPLTTVLGYTGLLCKAEDVTGNRKNYIKIIEQETIRAQGMLRNLLDFSRRRPPFLVKNTLSDIINQAVEDVQSRRKKNSINGITLRCSDVSSSTIQADAQEMMRAFRNIIDNAFNAMPGGGLFEIRCEETRDHAGKKVVIVEFEDNGAGISEEHMDKIFDPYFTTRKDDQGIGLGLPVSFLIVQSHGGRIEVESTSGKGSCFRIILPVFEEERGEICEQAGG